MMRWPKQVACIEENRNAYRILVGKPEGNRPLVQLGMGGNMLKCFLKKRDRRAWTGSIWLKIWISGKFFCIK